MIMIILTRSFVAGTRHRGHSRTFVGCIIRDLGIDLAVSFGFQLHWMVLPMSVIILLAVGSDYNLLLVSRMKEEIGAGINTGIIRAMGGTGKVVTNAGLVFAFTMMAMVVSDLRVSVQVGTALRPRTIVRHLGRSFVYDAVYRRTAWAWFWWPQKVRPRPASSLLWPIGPRPLVRSIVASGRVPDDNAATAESQERRSPSASTATG